MTIPRCIITVIAAARCGVSSSPSSALASGMAVLYYRTVPKPASPPVATNRATTTGILDCRIPEIPWLVRVWLIRWSEETRGEDQRPLGMAEQPASGSHRRGRWASHSKIRSSAGLVRSLRGRHTARALNTTRPPGEGGTQPLAYRSVSCLL